jgi:1-acyl-sn-glycerol-3-phosphate acyltransferase
MDRHQNDMHPLYRFCRTAVKGIVSVAFRLRVAGVENIPSSGPLIIASNHIHNFDPPVIGLAIPRFVRFMAKSELFANKPIAAFLTILGAFPVKRGGQDKSAIRTAIDIPAQQGCLLVFPEGHRSKTGKLGKAQPGIAFIARKAGCPIVPAVIIGPYRLFSPLSIRFGPPIIVDSSDSNESVLEKVMNGLQALLYEGPITK